MMTLEQIRSEQPDHKTKNVYFVDTIGEVWMLFGATSGFMLVCSCSFKNRDGVMVWGMVQRLDYDSFGRWVDRSDIVGEDGQAVVRSTTDTDN